MKKITFLSSNTNITGQNYGVDINLWRVARLVFYVESAGTLQVEGSIDGTIWIPLHTAVTTTSGLEVDTYPLMRAVSSGVSGGDVAVQSAFVRWS